MTYPAPTRADHDTFCQREGWQRVRDARGRTGTHHVTHELALPDGRILRTRVSHPPDRSTCGPALWAQILRDQLGVGEPEFWACVREGQAPDRGAPVVPERAIPAAIVHQLVVRHRVPESEVAAMTREQALERLQQIWAGESG